MREVEIWVGKTHDSQIPPRVKLRVFERYKGRCHWSGRLIRPGDTWDVDHIIALCNGGAHSEANMAPILRGKPHKEKTKADVAEKSKVYRKKSAHLGIKPKTSRPMPGSRASNIKMKIGGGWSYRND